MLDIKTYQSFPAYSYSWYGIAAMFTPASPWKPGHQFAELARNVVDINPQPVSPEVEKLADGRTFRTNSSTVSSTNIR